MKMLLTLSKWWQVINKYEDMNFFPYALSIYFVPTEEKFSWLDGRTEFPVAVAYANGFGRVVVTGPTGLEISGLWGFMMFCDLGSEFEKFIGILLVGKDGGIALDEEAGKPSRDAIIRARSW